MAITQREWADWSFPDGDRWTDWRSISDETLRGVPNAPGAYIIGIGRSIHRLLLEDPHGILDIGQSSNLRVRLAAFARCADGDNVRGHMAGWRLGAAGLLRKLDLERSALQVSWIEVRGEHNAYFAESRLLLSYYSLFGELPPLNYQFNWSAFEPES